MVASLLSPGRPPAAALALVLFAMAVSPSGAEAGESGFPGGRPGIASSSKRDPGGVRISVSLALGACLPGPGSAGVDAPAPPPAANDRLEPDCRDAFAGGLDAFASVGFSVAPAARIEAGAGYACLNGRSRDEGYLGRREYSDFRTFSAGVGARFSAPLSVGFKDWFASESAPRTSGFEPYLRLSAGLCYADRVELGSSGYWKASTVFFAEVCLGLEFGFGAAGFFVEGLVRYVSEPTEAVWFAEADQLTMFPLRAGVRIYF